MPHTFEQICGAVARGWCAPENSGKEMDVRLAPAISKEVWKLVRPENLKEAFQEYDIPLPSADGEAMNMAEIANPKVQSELIEARETLLRQFKHSLDPFDAPALLGRVERLIDAKIADYFDRMR